MARHNHWSPGQLEARRTHVANLDKYLLSQGPELTRSKSELPTCVALDQLSSSISNTFTQNFTQNRTSRTFYQDTLTKMQLSTLIGTLSLMAVASAAALPRKHRTQIPDRDRSSFSDTQVARPVLQRGEDGIDVADGFKKRDEAHVDIADGFKIRSEESVDIADGFKKREEAKIDVADGFRKRAEGNVDIADGF